jgi:Flp pilus assembly protein TadG
MENLMIEIPLKLSLLRSRGGKWKAIGSARREEAQSLVELALVVPLFILLLLGSAEFAQFAWASVLTSNAARAGASWGAQSPTNAANATQGIQAAAAADSVNLTGLTTTTPPVSCVCSNGTPIPAGQCSNAGSYCATPATITDYVTVNTTSTVSVFGHSFTVTGQSIMVVAQ